VRLQLLLAFVCALSTLAGSSGAQARPEASYLIQASASFQRLGPYWVSDKPDYAGAIAALGRPTSCHLVNTNPAHVTASWRALGVTIVLVTFGGMPQGKTGCTAPELIRVSTIRVTGKRWYTSKKLKVGDSVSRLQRLYPKATPTKGIRGWYGRGHWLVTRRTVCLGDCDTRFVTAPVLVAETKTGRVSSIVFIVGAQGE
jgi:hypothetical protein